MSNPVPNALQTFLERTTPEPTVIQQEMAEHGHEIGFPIIGPAAGGTCLVVARLVGARSVFECGSGFGYSATWFGRALPPTGRMVLTDRDPDHLKQARSYLERAGLADRAAFEAGDALEIVDRDPGPFDIVLLDHEKRRYTNGFETVRDKIDPGGAVIADNILSGAVEFETVRRLVEGDELADPDANSAGIATYLGRVGEDPAFETVVLPVGNGLAVSVRRGNPRK